MRWSALSHRFQVSTHDRGGPSALSPECMGKLLHAGKALLRLLREGTIQRSAEICGSVRPGLEDLGGRLEYMLVQNAVGGPIEGLLAGQDLVTHDGEGILIDSAIHLQPLGLLRGHVM